MPGSRRRTRCSARCTARACRFGDFLESARAEDPPRRPGGRPAAAGARASIGYAFAALFGPTPVPEALDRCEEVFTLAEGDKRAVGDRHVLLREPAGHARELRGGA